MSLQLWSAQASFRRLMRRQAAALQFILRALHPDSTVNDDPSMAFFRREALGHRARQSGDAWRA